MGKFVKFLVGALAVVVVLVVIAAIVLPMVIDPNDFKPQITAAVKDKTGRDLTINGDLELSVFPWIGVDIGALSLSNAPGFGDQNFAEIEHAMVKVKILPLLSKKVEVSQIVLKGLLLNLAKNPKGVTNWSDLAKSGEQQPETAPEPEAKQPPEEKSGAPALADLAIGGVAIEDAKIRWNDQQAGKKIEVKKFDFHMGELTFDEPVDFDMGVQVSLNEPQLTETATLSGSVIINENLNAFQLNGINLESHSEGKAIPGNTLDATLVGAIAADLEQQTLQLSGIKLSAHDLVVTTDLSGTQILDAPKINGPLTIAQFSPRAFMQKLGMKVPETKDPKALNALSASLNVNATDNSVGLKDIVIKLDETSINGEASVVDLKKSALRFQFDIDKMNVDRYLPPPAEKGGEQKQQTAKTPSTSPPPATETAGEASELPMDALRALDVKGTVSIAELIASGLTMKGINLTVDGKNGIIKSDQLIQSLYQGKFKGDLNLDVRGPKPKIALNEDVKGVQVEPLLKDASGKATLAGSVNLDAKLTGIGATADAIKSSLNGNVNALFTDGAIIGFSLIKYIRSAKSAIKTLKGEAVATTSDEDRTEFSEMKMVSVINNGVVNNQELSAKSPLLRVNGSGLIDLPRDKLDYKLVAKVVGSLKGQGGDDLQEMKGVPIALKITGSTQKPSVSLDLENMLMESQKAKIEEKKKELLDKGDKIIDDKLKKFAPRKKDLLRKLF